MAKIKGWDKIAEQDDIIVWQTSSKPYFSVWMNPEGSPLTKTGLWVVSNDFTYPVEKRFTNKQRALSYSSKLMRDNPPESAYEGKKVIV